MILQARSGAWPWLLQRTFMLHHHTADKVKGEVDSCEERDQTGGEASLYNNTLQERICFLWQKNLNSTKPFMRDPPPWVKHCPPDPTLQHHHTGDKISVWVLVGTNQPYPNHSVASFNVYQFFELFILSFSNLPPAMCCAKYIVIKC